jgi:hypothetical protein
MNAYTHTMAPMNKKPLNLTLPEELIEEIKIQAVREKKTVSEIAEDLFRKHLDQQQKRARGKSKS